MNGTMIEAGKAVVIEAGKAVVIEAGKAVVIEVTLHDIERSRQLRKTTCYYAPGDCPMACALWRLLPDALDLMVSARLARVTLADGVALMGYGASKQEEERFGAFTDRWDKEREAEPFTLTLLFD